MAGATLSSSLPSRFAVKLENGDTTGLDIGMNIREGKMTVDDGGVLACPYCSFTTTSLSELKSHRWEVHPLLAKRKGHLMCMSPKNSRKRPNSESSEDGKLTDPDEGAPKKKASPRHSPLVSNETTSHFHGAIVRANRSSSADDIMVLNCKSKALIPEKQTGIVDYTPSNLPIQSKSPSSFRVNNFKFLSPPNTDKFDYNSSRRSASESPNSDSGCVPSPTSPTAYDETCDLHTLAKAALNASPIPQPHSVNFYENKSLLVPPSMGYHLHPYSYVIGGNFGSSYPMPYMNNFYYHGYHPNEERVAFEKSLESKTTKEASPTTCFPHQASFTSNRIMPPAIPTHISSNFISSANTRVNPALYHPSSVPGSQTTLSTPVNSDKYKLSALSQVATDCLSPAPVGRKDNEASPKPFSYYQPENMEVLNQKKKGVVLSESSLRENLRKPDVDQRQRETKSIMGDDRVRLLEEALSKIDCCDPQERTNALPYRCPDGKWRMVQAKCVGGAWLIQVPGAPHPSVHVPYQKKSSSYETLDDWLKARLTATDRSFQHKSDSKPPNSSIKQYSQVGRQFFAAINSKRPSGFFNSGANQPVQSGAIKSLLLQKSTLS